MIDQVRDAIRKQVELAHVHAGSADVANAHAEVACTLSAVLEKLVAAGEETRP